MASSKKTIRTGRKTHSRIAVIGAGFSGIGVAAQLERWYGITDVTLFDGSSSPAGTWTNNRYPGCACDVPAALYSFSYEQNPNWSRVLAKQPEIQAYLEAVARKYKIYERLHTDTFVKAARWNDSSLTWTLELHAYKTGETWFHESPILFNCAGGLDEPRNLDTPGVESFRGPIFHTARWDDSIDLGGKRVAVIGNGCTGIQCVPALVNEIGVKSVTHYIRARHWIFPSFDTKYPKSMTWGFKNVPGLLALHRFHVYQMAELAWPSFYMNEKGAKLRQRRQAVAETYMRTVAPREYHDMLIPDFEIGCKRRIYDYGYCEVLNKDNVKLTDKKTLEIVPDGIRTEDGVEEFDAIVVANGFNLEREKTAVKITGRNGEDLQEHWERQGGTGAYKCVAVSGFPNLMFIAGPNSATGHTSVVIAAENTTNLALRVLKPVLNGSAKTVEPLKNAEVKWNAELQKASKDRVWVKGGCSSWYVGKNDWVSTLYPWSQFHMMWMSWFPTWSDWNYRTSSDQRYTYRGLDRFVKPISLMVMFISTAAYFIRVGVKLPWH